MSEFARIRGEMLITVKKPGLVLHRTHTRTNLVPFRPYEAYVSNLVAATSDHPLASMKMHKFGHPWGGAS